MSVAIQEIEREYQLQLFERLSRRLYLTDAGQEFLEYAQRIASTFDDMDRQLKEKKDHETIRIGASITIGSRRMPEYVKQFQSCHPLAEVFVKVGFSRDLEKMLLVNELDLALVETPVHNKELEAEKYAADRLDLVMPATQGYEANLEMPLERFLQEDILLREKGVPLWEATSTTALLNAVQSGLGVTVLPHQMAEDAVNGGRVVRGSIRKIRMEQAFFIVYHQDKMRTPLMQDFMDIVRGTQPL